MSDERSEGGRAGRWQRREKRRASERARLQKHGAALKRIYADAIRKRLAEKLEQRSK